MPDQPPPYYGTWINRQRSLLPELHEELDPLTDKLERLIVILDTLGLEAFVAPPSRGRGRPPDDRPAIARSFVAKAVLKQLFSETFNWPSRRATADLPNPRGRVKQLG